MKRLILILMVAATGCMPLHFGASQLALSDYHVDYDGPVYANSGYTPAQGAQVMAAHVDEQSGPIVIVDYELNGVLDGVWGVDDHNAEYTMQFMRERCVVRLLGDRLDPSPALEAARADIQALASVRDSLGFETVVVDWRPVLAEHPEYVGPDGVHKATREAALAYAQLIDDGKAQCDG
jgi:hypothetical protein